MTGEFPLCILRGILKNFRYYTILDDATIIVNLMHEPLLIAESK
jgi:hypothetical protein